MPRAVHVDLVSDRCAVDARLRLEHRVDADAGD